jgi:hypothetical protein
MAGCSEDYVGDPAQKCQAAIGKCSPGFDVCRNLKPDSGPDAIFGLTRQPLPEKCYASTWGPGPFGGYDTTFDRRFACSDPVLLAKVMVHESIHACRAAGGIVDIHDHDNLFRLGTEGCHAQELAPVKEGKQCGDSL